MFPQAVLYMALTEIITVSLIHMSVICNHCNPTAYGDGQGGSEANVRGSDVFRPPTVVGKCRASDIMQITRMEFTIIKSSAMTFIFLGFFSN